MFFSCFFLCMPLFRHPVRVFLWFMCLVLGVLLCFFRGPPSHVLVLVDRRSSVRFVFVLACFGMYGVQLDGFPRVFPAITFFFVTFTNPLPEELGVGLFLVGWW